MTVSLETLTVPEAAAVAGVSARTMRRWVTSGQVRTVGSGHRRRVVAASLSEMAATVDTIGQEDRSPEDTVSATTATEADRSANVATADIEADRLADLVRDLTGKLAEQTGLTMVWMERCRVLSDQLALAPPAESPVASDPGQMVPAPTTNAPVLLLARLRVLTPWLLLVALMLLVLAVGWPLAWGR